jgi:hypothetical protein
MKHAKSIWLFLGCLGLFSLLQATPNTTSSKGKKPERGLCGKLSQNVTLIRSESPYYLTADLWVPKGFTLNIEPGVEIIVRPGHCPNKDSIPQWNWADSQWVAIKVEGSLGIFGKSDLPITLKGAKWGGIQWAGIMIQGPLRNNPETGIEFARIYGAFRGIWAKNTRFNVVNSLFEANQVGIELAEKGDLRIAQNTFAQNFAGGLVQRAALPQVYGNLFYRNGDVGIGSDGRRGPNIGNNLFWGHVMDCLKCPPEVGKRQGKAPDRFGNIFLDPIFVGTPSEAAARKADPNSPSTQAQDPAIARATAKAHQKGKAGVEVRKSDFSPRGLGPWRLSQWSPGRNAGPKHFFFSNPDGSRGDIGMHGGAADRALRNWPQAVW